MMRLNRKLIGCLLGVLTIVALTACQPTPTATPTPLAALDIVRGAVTSIQTAKTFKIKLELTGAPVGVNTSKSITFVSANGQYVAPDRVSARVVARLLGLAAEVDVVTIGDNQWYKNSILTGGKFIAQAFAPGFNAATLVTSDKGIGGALLTIQNLTLVGRESLNGTDVYHLSGNAQDKDIASLTVGLIQGSKVDIDLYIDAASLKAIEIVLVQPDTVSATQPKPSRWDLTIFDYDVAATIDAPATVATTAATSAATVAPTVSDSTDQTTVYPTPSPEGTLATP
jgi:hypothetical protein